MSFDGSSSQLLNGTTSRRAIVKTGVKVAYATPIIAASIGLATQHGFAASPPSTTRICSGPMDFGPMGWGGWSCPAGTRAVGGGYEPADAVVTSSQIAAPGSVWPHYTFGAEESGWVVQNSNVGQTLTVCVDCAAI